MKLYSVDMQNNSALPNKCIAAALGGDDTPLALQWDDVPNNAKSLALTCFDPDAPTGSGFWHWIVANINVSAKGAMNINDLLSQGAEMSFNDAGSKDFIGANPPLGDGAHCYIFTLHALAIASIDVENLPQAYVRYFIHTNSIASASISGYFAADNN